MKVLVTGGAGYIGSHVADALTRAGHRVTVFDIIESPYVSGDQKMIRGDILDAGVVMKAVEGQDIVYHFAGIADLDSAGTRPMDTVQLNIAGIINIAEACVANKVKRLVYASTIYVYSRRGGFYRCSKQAAELYIEEYQNRFNLDYTILRYGTLYGPRATGNNSIYRYIRSAVEDGKLVCDNPDEIREYIHVRDAANLSVDILDESYINQHIILTGHYRFQVREMMEIIREIFNSRVDIEYMASPERNRDHYRYTPYSYSPRIGVKLVGDTYTDIGQGILECIEDYESGKHQAL